MTKEFKEFVEEGANLEHDRWARWQKYLHSKMNRLSCSPNYMSLPIELYNRWERQINTPYSELSESEKESDRKETRNYLPLIKKHFLPKSVIRAKIKECLDYCLEQNGIPVCKNCGLGDDEFLKDLDL